MNYIKSILMTIVTALSISAHAQVTQAEVLENCAQDIIQLVADKEVPEIAATKLHMVQIVPNADGYRVVAVLDHNGDHSQPIAHMKFQYDIEGKMMSFQYVDGYSNPADTLFNQKSTAELLDIATQFLIESADPVLSEYAKNLKMVHIDFDSVNTAALFEILDTNGKEAALVLGLDGQFIGFQFLN